MDRHSHESIRRAQALKNLEDLRELAEGILAPVDEAPPPLSPDVREGLRECASGAARGKALFEAGDGEALGHEYVDCVRACESLQEAMSREGLSHEARLFRIFAAILREASVVLSRSTGGAMSKVIAAGVLGALLFSASARGAFEGPGSASAEGMGNAVAAKGGEAVDLFSNPGGLALMDRGELSVMYAKPLTGIPDISMQQGSLAAAVPMGAAWTLAAGARYADNAGLAKETEGSLAAAGRFGRLSLGAAAVYLNRSYDVGSIPGASSDPVFAKGSSKGGIGVDAGVLYEASEALTLGAAGRNLNRPDLGLVGEDKVPMTWRAGAAYRWNRLTFLGEARGRSEATDADSKWGVGAEFHAAGPLLLRVGADADQVSAGMGLAFRDLKLDYAFSFIQSLGAGEAGNHRMSLGYRFGAIRGDAVPAYRPAVVRKAAAPRTAARQPSSAISTRDTRAYPTQERKPVIKRRFRPLF